MIDRAKFFNAVRTSVFHGHLAQPQVDGTNFILNAWETRPDLIDLRWLAYMLGTGFIETAATMQPVHEYGGPAYFTRMYDVTGGRPEMARRMGNTTPGDGIKYCGRGLPQLTWKNNYALMATLTGYDLVGNPDLAMQPDIAIKIMFIGMTAEVAADHFKGQHPEDTFSGVSLAHYFNDHTEDWVGARRIINGVDHADLVAETSKSFHAALA